MRTTENDGPSTKFRLTIRNVRRRVFVIRVLRPLVLLLTSLVFIATSPFLMTLLFLRMLIQSLDESRQRLSILNCRLLKRQARRNGQLEPAIIQPTSTKTSWIWLRFLRRMVWIWNVLYTKSSSDKLKQMASSFGRSNEDTTASSLDLTRKSLPERRRNIWM